MAVVAVGTAMAMVPPAGAVAVAAASSGSAASAPDRWGTVWLCRPSSTPDPCDSSRKALVMPASGRTSLQYAPRPRPPRIDCFYVYPTVSPEPSPNADLTIQPAEVDTARAQASRFSQYCNLFAPMYRQATLAALSGRGSAQAGTIAYQSLLSTWQDYIEHYNHGRGVVLIGHSQGAVLLTLLAASQIDANAGLRHRLVSALLLGGNVTVRQGSNEGGSFRNIPACRSSRQTGCVVAYSSFDSEPPPNSVFGRVGPGAIGTAGRSATDLQVLCANPANLAGGRGILDPYLPTGALAGPGGQAGSIPVTEAPWVTFPRQYSGQCESRDGANWLQVTADATPGDRRTPIHSTLPPTWGLHLVDVNIALGNLVTLVRSESASYLASTRSH